MSPLAKFGAAGLVLVGLVLVVIHFLPTVPALPVKPCPLPIPLPIPVPEPPKPRKPWFPRGTSVEADALENKAPDGSLPIVEYPESQWFSNIGSKIDGRGMCVFTAAEFMAIWSGLESYRGFRDWCAASHAGGGWPEKLSDLMEKYAKAKGIPPPKLYQYVGPDLSMIEKMIATGRFPGCTLHISKRYGRPIAHVVNVANGGPRFYAICDNNQMKGDSVPPYEWFNSAAAFAIAIKQGPNYWCFCLERCGTPPPPKN